MFHFREQAPRYYVVTPLLPNHTPFLAYNVLSLYIYRMNKEGFKKFVNEKLEDGVPEDGLDLYEAFIEYGLHINRHPKTAWKTTPPEESGMYLCRMDDAYIKMCYWTGITWLDAWMPTISGKVVKWTEIPD